MRHKVCEIDEDIPELENVLCRLRPRPLLPCDDASKRRGVMGFEFWEKGWRVMADAPQVVIPLFIAVGLVGFVVARWGYSREIAALSATINVLNQRLLLAADQQATLTKDVEALRVKAAHAVSPSEVSGEISKVATANSVLGSTLSRIAAGYDPTWRPRRISTIEPST